MKQLSTGEPSTLGIYLQWAQFHGLEAIGFIQELIDIAPNGADEEVLVDEQDMMLLFNLISHACELEY